MPQWTRTVRQYASRSAAWLRARAAGAADWAADRIDAAVGFFDPAAGLVRMEHRRALVRARNLYGRERRGRENHLPPSQQWYDPDWHMRQTGRVMERQRDRSDSLQLANINPIAKGLARTVTDFVWPAAPEFQSQDPDPEIAKRYDADMHEWLAGAWDVKDRDFNQTGRRFVQFGFIAGDAGFAMLDAGEDADRVQLLTGDRIWHVARADARDPELAIVDGVAVDDVGRPRAYYVRDKDLQSIRIPATNFAGFHFDEFHHDDVRGQPAFATTYDKILQYDDLCDAVVSAMRMAAKVAFVIKRANPGPPVTPDPKQQTPRTPLANGMIIDNLRPGDDVSQMQGNQLGQQLDPFGLQLLRIIGMPDGVPLELLNLNFAQGSFSAINAAFAMWRHRVKTWQNDLAQGPLARLWRWRVDRRIAAGKLPFSPFRYRHIWTPKPAEYLFPQEQAQADAILRDLGLKTWAQLCLERGLKPEQQLAAIEKWEGMLRDAKAGIARSTATRPDPTTLPPVDPAHAATVAATQPAQPQKAA